MFFVLRKITDFLKRFLPHRDFVFLMTICAFLSGFLFSAEHFVLFNVSSVAKAKVRKAVDCSSPMELVNGKCLEACTNGHQRINGVCSCPSNAILNGMCLGQCTKGHILSSKTGGCVCPPDQKEVSEACVRIP